MVAVEQLSLAGMPARLFACTPSRLAAFDCPRRYRYTYLDRPPPPRGHPWAHNTVGAIAHLALAKWWALPAAHRTPQLGASLVESNWQNIGFRDAAQSARVCARTAGWVRQYLAHTDGSHEPVGVERTVATRTARLAVSGRIDRIDERGNELVVIDYKTGRRELTADDARGSQALALYVLGVRRTLRRPCRRVELHHLPTGAIASFEHTEASLQRQSGPRRTDGGGHHRRDRHPRVRCRRRRRLSTSTFGRVRVVRLPRTLPGGASRVT